METKLKYINIYKNRHGKSFIYVRRYRTQPSIEIKAPINSQEFLDEYREAIRIQEDGVGAKLKTKDTIKSNSLNWLYEKYMASPEFLQLGVNTQPQKRRRLKAVMLEGISQVNTRPYGDRDYTQMNRKHVL